MAANAQSKRDASASKLRDSMRQLRRYLDGEDQIERILVQKSDKVDVDREELIAKHHIYAEKAGINLDDEEMRTYIEEKIDAAVDIVDEAIVLIEQLSKNKQKHIEESQEEGKKIEKSYAQNHYDICYI